MTLPSRAHCSRDHALPYVAVFLFSCLEGPIDNVCLAVVQDVGSGGRFLVLNRACID